MAGNLLELTIVTPAKMMVTDRVDQVNVPGSEGDLGILYDHAAILTAMRPGQLSYEKKGGENKERETIVLVVSGGYLEVTDNRVIVLAETAEFLHEIDRKRAESAKVKAEATLGRLDLTHEEVEDAQKKLFRAIARLEQSEEQ